MNLLKIRKHAPGWLFGAAVMFLVTAALGSSTFAQTARRSVSPNGKAAVTYFNSAEPGEEDIYLIKMRKGQSCRVGLKWQVDNADNHQGDSRLTIVHPDGRKLADARDGFIQASTAGDYKIVVSPRATKTNYRYRITFTQL